jgi:hypothetical protein
MVKERSEMELPAMLEAAHKLPSSKVLGKKLGVDERARLSLKIEEIAQLFGNSENASKAVVNARLHRAVELYESLQPGDGAEGMLALQMVGTHDAALACLRRAAQPSHTFAELEIALKHAHKLMTLYARQLAALNKHRGKGQQKVTVEYVNVESGGQAVVGNVEAGQTGQAAHRAPPEIEHAPEAPLPKVKRKSKAARKR